MKKNYEQYQIVFLNFQLRQWCQKVYNMHTNYKVHFSLHFYEFLVNTLNICLHNLESIIVNFNLPGDLICQLSELL